MDTPALIYVTDTYGDRYRIDANQLYMTMRHQLCIYTSTWQRTI